MTFIKIAFILMLGIPFSCHPQAQVTGNINNEEIKVELGQTFKITLPSHPGTGFTWELQGTIDSTIIQFIKKEYQEIGDESFDVPGADVFQFKALKKGQTPIRFWYFRPWKKEHDYPGIKTEVYTVIIK